MADTTVHVTTLALNTATANPAGTAIDAAKVGVVTITRPCRKVILRITNTAAAAKVVTITAGDNPPAGAASLGDIATSFADGSVTPVIKLFVLEAARFMQNDGVIRITYEAGTTGFVEAIELP